MIERKANLYPVSAQCKVLGVARATYYYLLKHKDDVPASDPLTNEVVAIFNENHSRYGTRRIRTVLIRRGKVASRRYIGNILKAQGLTCISKNKSPLKGVLR